MLDITAQLPLVETETPDPDSKPCEQCGEPFVPRRNGGKAQRFCGSECRVAFNNSQRVNVSNKSPTNHQQINDTLGTDDTLGIDAQGSTFHPPAATKNNEQAAAPKDDPDRFDWSDQTVIVHEQQPATAAYFNPRGGLVIRQRSPYWDDEDDPFICINAENIDAFLDRLMEVCGRGRK